VDGSLNLFVFAHVKKDSNYSPTSCGWCRHNCVFFSSLWFAAGAWSELTATNAPVEDEPVEPVLRMNISLPACVFFFPDPPCPKILYQKNSLPPPSYLPSTSPLLPTAYQPHPPSLQRPRAAVELELWLWSGSWSCGCGAGAGAVAVERELEQLELELDPRAH
jgi:hypothetical protein